MKLLMWITRRVGVWFMRMVAFTITAGYFLFCPRRVKCSMDLYRAVFPGRGRAHYLYGAWRQFHDLAASYCDRLSLEAGGKVTRIYDGDNPFDGPNRWEGGGILLTSHVGNWEIGARLFKRKGLKLLLLMGEKEAKAVARSQRKEMQSEGLAISVSSVASETTFAGLQALEFLEKGGFVAVAGDLAWANQRRRVKVSLFGRETLLPGGPHLLALLSGAPIFTFFIFRAGRTRYRVSISGPRWVKAASLEERNRAVRQSAEAYARELEAAVRKYPWQWHVFEPILGPPAAVRRSSSESSD